MKRVTINDVAQAAHVSKTTVSHYLNGRYTAMGEDTKKRISRAVRDLNYQPNVVAKSLKDKKTMTIGIIVANILHSFSTQIIRAIEDYARRVNYHVIVCNADNDSHKEEDYIRMLRAKQVDGIVVIPTEGNAGLFTGLAAEGYPTVFVDRIIGGAPVPSFMLDNETAVRVAFSHLTAKGHSAIGFVSQPLCGITPRHERLDEYRRLCGKNDMETFEIIGKLDAMEDCISRLTSEGKLPGALIVSNDLALFEVLKALKHLGLIIPDDVSIITIDDIGFAEFFNPAITAVAQPAFSIGTEAAQSLFDIINGGEHPVKTHRFKPELIIRESVKDYANE